MAVYTVHQPPLRSDERTPAPERYAFVRDGFSFCAFVFGPLWMLRHRMWIVLVIYAALAAPLLLGLYRGGASWTVLVTALVLIRLLLGLEAATLRRFTLARRRWRELGVVVGEDRETAERRFFVRFAGAREERAREQVAPATPRPRADAAPQVVGLFPEPGAPR